MCARAKNSNYSGSKSIWKVSIYFVLNTAHTKTDPGTEIASCTGDTLIGQKAF
jgi:hypothetical protein